MAIIPSAYWKFFWPLVLVGATGLGVRLYIDDVQLLVNNDFLSNGTYSRKLVDAGLTLVSDETSEEVLQNILIQRMYPHYHEQYKYAEGRIFTGSKEFTLSGKSYTANENEKMFIFDTPGTNDAQELKEACKVALSSDLVEKFDNKTTSDQQYYRLKEWCTEPTIKAVLARHKLTLLKTEEESTVDDEQWKEVIGGGWFKTEHKDQQTFIVQSELDKFLGGKKTDGINSKDDVTPEHIKELKGKCKEVLNEPFKRKSFPAPKAFLDLLNEDDKAKFTEVDKFQEAALFCTKPMSAEDYIDKAMQGESRKKLPENGNLQNDFCLDSSKSIEQYKSVQTNQPFDGKSFWCAVRILYEKNKAKAVGK